MLDEGLRRTLLPGLPGLDEVWQGASSCRWLFLSLALSSPFLASFWLLMFQR